MLHSRIIHIQPYTYTCGNIVNTIMTNEHTSLEKIYLSHFIQNGFERVLCERWVGDWTNCNILTLSSFVFISASFSFCWAAQSGVLRAHSPLLGAGSLNRLYNCLTSTCFLWASHLHPIQPVHSQGYTLISSTGCTCAFIDGWVEGQYVTLRFEKVADI